MRLLLPILFAATSFSGCGDHAGPTPVAERRGAPPPPAATTSASQACDRPVTDVETAGFVPPKLGPFCVESASVAYGKDAPKPIHDICDVFDGECEIYLGLGIEREVELRYVAGSALISA